MKHSSITEPIPPANTTDAVPGTGEESSVLLQSPATPAEDTPPPAELQQKKRWISAVVLVTVIAFLILGSSLVLKLLEWLAYSEASLLSVMAAYPVLSFLVIAIAYVLLQALPIPASPPLAILAGWLFGFPAGLVFSCVVSNAAAVVTFVTIRSSGKTVALPRSWEEKIERVNLDWLVLTARLLPGVPFFLANAAIATTSISLLRFYLISQVGMIPAKIFMTGVGSRLPSIRSVYDTTREGGIPYQIVAGLLIVGGLFAILRKFVRSSKKRLIIDSDDASASALETSQGEPK